VHNKPSLHLHPVRSEFVRHVFAQLECKLERRVEQIRAEDVVTHVLQVIVWLQDAPAEEVEAVHHGDAKVLDGAQNVFERDQVSAEQTATNSIKIVGQ